MTTDKTLSEHFYVIYDGNCNLCSNLVQLLEGFDRGKLFSYAPMQDESTLQRFGITADDCQLGMLLIDAAHPERRWQGSAAAEEISRLLPAGQAVIDLYRAIPGVKWGGDRLYEQIRDNRYTLFGKRSETYQTAYPICDSGACHSSASPT
jgi:predicted DCC family thiol-disulfide oxidoreductase YuxK